MPVTEKIAGITDKIIERSRASRRHYLDRIEKAHETQPQRARLGCANLACGATDKALREGATIFRVQ